MEYKRITIAELNLSVRPRNSLSDHNIDTIDDLLKLTEEGFYSWRYVGKKSVAEVKQKLKEYNLEFRKKDLQV